MSEADFLELQLRQLGRIIELKKRPDAMTCFYVIFSDYPSENFINKLLELNMSEQVREFLLATKMIVLYNDFCKI